MPSTAGLNDITARLCALPEKLTHRETTEFLRCGCVPPVPRCRSRRPRWAAGRSAAWPRHRNMPRADRTARTRSFTPSGPSGCTVWAGRAWRRPARPTASRHDHLDCRLGLRRQLRRPAGPDRRGRADPQDQVRQFPSGLPLAGDLGAELRLAARPEPRRQPAGNDAAHALAVRGRQDPAPARLAEDLGRELQAAGPAEHGRRVLSTAAARSSGWPSRPNRGERMSSCRKSDRTWVGGPATRRPAARVPRSLSHPTDPRNAKKRRTPPRGKRGAPFVKGSDGCQNNETREERPCRSSAQISGRILHALPLRFESSCLLPTSK